ncbi:hypothetical protein [Youxingia wuxianensis]|uniref:Uncharacterized protein n=1 Tax=Youxingia wuxianensis TaxID=2763678 RepID=A0A926EMA7_9FIRM|nr:hypothetical protein [Youxingia wuxianensis]MBC8584528.1 hypothetical protein [Youxingia wuxianensis]
MTKRLDNEIRELEQAVSSSEINTPYVNSLLQEMKEAMKNLEDLLDK